MDRLDFGRAAHLFVSSDRELGAALRITTTDVARYRRQPDTVPPEVLTRLGTILAERGRAMTRVGEMLQEAHAD